jgi:hypothetical protein
MLFKFTVYVRIFFMLFLYAQFFSKQPHGSGTELQ